MGAGGTMDAVSGLRAPGRATSVGKRVRELREAQGMSARALAERAGVTPAYVSRLEGGRLSPTIATLSRVTEALREPLWRVFAEQGGKGPVVRAEDRKVIQNEGFVDTLITPTREGRLEIFEVNIESRADSGGLYSHRGEEECVYILQGQLRFHVGDEEYRLGPGDSCTFGCHVPHGFENVGDEPVRVIWVITPGGSAQL